VRGQLVQPQLQCGEAAAQLVRDVADEVALALDQLGERARGSVEDVGDPVQLGDPVPVRGPAEVTGAEPGGAVGDVPQRLGQPPGGHGGDHGTRPDRQHDEQHHDQRHLHLLGAQHRARLGQRDRRTRPDRQRLGDRVGPDVRAEELDRPAVLLQHQPTAGGDGQCQRVLVDGVERAGPVEPGRDLFEPVEQVGPAEVLHQPPGGDGERDPEHQRG
jgi:hypothetical protein